MGRRAIGVSMAVVVAAALGGAACANVWGFGDAHLATDAAAAGDSAVDVDAVGPDGAPASFVKHGNDGTASCDTFCARSIWGPVGTCLKAKAANVPCDQVVGLLANADEIVCRCHDASGSFDRHGNNGTVSCNAYCASGARRGTCDLGVIPKMSCAQATGKLANGAELACTCEGDSDVSCSSAPCATPANGRATCNGGTCSRTCDDGFAACGAGCCAAPPAFPKYGNDGTVSCDAYCASAASGPAGTCVLAQALDVPCSQATGYFSNGSRLTCTCSASGRQFDKPGDDGSASCDTYCAGPQWGDVGTCVHAAALDVPCSQPLATGHLTNRADLECTCQ